MIEFSQPFAECSTTCVMTHFPDDAVGKHPLLRGGPRAQPELDGEPAERRSTGLPAREDHRRQLRQLPPVLRRQGEGMGTPLLPPLQLGDERLLVPLVGGGQREQAWRIRRRLAPRPRHLRRGGGDERELGLVPERQHLRRIGQAQAAVPGQSVRRLDLPRRIQLGHQGGLSGLAQLQQDLPPHLQADPPARPEEADDDRRDRFHRQGGVEGRLDQGHAEEGPHPLSQGPRGRLARPGRSRDRVADRDLLAQGPQGVHKGDRESGLPPEHLRRHHPVADPPAGPRAERGDSTTRPLRRPSCVLPPPRARGGHRRGRSSVAGGSPG